MSGSTLPSRPPARHPLQRVVPALFQGGGDQAVAIHGLIAPFGQIGVVTGAFDAPPPLRGDGRIAFFQIAQRRDGKLDRQRRDSVNNARAIDLVSIIM